MRNTLFYSVFTFDFKCFHISKKERNKYFKYTHPGNTLLTAYTVEGHNRDIRSQNLPLNRSETPVLQWCLFLFLHFFQFLTVSFRSLLSHVISVLSQTLTTQQFFCSVFLWEFVVDGDLPPHPKQFYPLYGWLILFNGKGKAGKSSFPGHHITLWHFSLEVCDLYQGAEPSVSSANYWPLPGSSLASHTLNSHFLDTWAIRVFTNTTNTWGQPGTGQAGRTGECVCVCMCVLKGGIRVITVCECFRSF